MSDHKERARQLAEDWHEGVPRDAIYDWACRAAGLLLHFSQTDADVYRGIADRYQRERNAGVPGTFNDQQEKT